jgi:hypothetical protein
VVTAVDHAAIYQEMDRVRLAKKGWRCCTYHRGRTLASSTKARSDHRLRMRIQCRGRVAHQQNVRAGQ